MSDIKSSELHAAPLPVSVGVEGVDDRFFVRRIICVGRNYAAHAREMGADPDKEPPFFFFKPTDTIVENGASVPYPPMTSNLHHEVELVVAIGEGGADLAVEDAQGRIFGYAVGIDMTRRDLQLKAREMGRPWDWGKGFDHSAPCSAIVPASRIGHPSTNKITLKVNDELRQGATLSDLIWTVPEIVSIVSGAMALQPGDLIFTGTPAGVGPLNRGDSVVAEVEGVARLEVMIS